LALFLIEKNIVKYLEGKYSPSVEFSRMEPSIKSIYMGLFSWLWIRAMDYFLFFAPFFIKFLRICTQ